MAALDVFLELEPLEALGACPAGAPAAGLGCGSPSAASAGTAAPLWAFKQQPKAQPHKRQRQLDAYSTDEEEAELEEEFSVSPGCFYSADAGLAGGLLELDDDACSMPVQHHQQQVGEQQQRQQQKEAVQLPDGTVLVAATFFDDLAARGSVYQYCLSQ